MIAESAGLIGAALRRSPVVAASEPNAFQFPRIRDWLSFTAERAYTKSVVLLAGIAVRGSAGALAPVIRPFPNASSSELPGVIQVRSNLIPWRGSEAGREGYFSRSAQSLVK